MCGKLIVSNFWFSLGVLPVHVWCSSTSWLEHLLSNIIPRLLSEGLAEGSCKTNFCDILALLVKLFVYIAIKYVYYCVSFLAPIVSLLAGVVWRI